MEIQIDLTRDSLLTAAGHATLCDGYMLPEEKSPQEAFARAAKAFGSNPEHAQRIYDYASKLWFMFASPVLSNGGTERGMPISCFLNYVPDSRKGLLEHYTENGWLASMGGGIGAFWGDVRSDGQPTSHGSRSNGTVPFLKIPDAEMVAFSQGVTRRGSYAAYQDISHPEIEEFIEIRKPTGGDIGRKCLGVGFHHGINITDAFMEAVVKDAKWDLIDPNSKKVTKTVSARQLWEKILETRIANGEPYLHFVDTSNRALPSTQARMGLKVRQSNLCTEITLATDEKRTAVCCLSSVNLDKWEEWKSHPTFIADLIEYLDNIITFFCEHNGVRQYKSFDIAHGYEDAVEFYETLPLFKAAFSAYRERALGLGAMGFHSLLQQKKIPMDSAVAKSLNRAIFKHIKEKADAATISLGTSRGEAPDMRGTGRRNSHLLAIAPNASSSIICGGVSPGIEMYPGNAYTHKTKVKSFEIRNAYLAADLEKLGLNTDEVWSSIMTNNGSVQHLEIPQELKDIYQTALEADQRVVVDLAADRQAHICQGQSINLYFTADVDAGYLNNVHIRAWKKGVKSLYYCRSKSLGRAQVVSKRVIKAAEPDECLACQG